jgi:hypothetical protein
MRVLKGAEVQGILNDLAGIMDLPYPESETLETPMQLPVSNGDQVGNKVQTWSDPISPASSAAEVASDDNGADDLLLWPSELKLAFNNVKNNLTVAVNNTSASVSDGITVSGGRKRKMWDNTDSPVAKVPTPSPQDRQQMNPADDQQMVVTEPRMARECGNGSSVKLMTTVGRLKGNKDPLSGISTPVVSGAVQGKDKVKKGDSGKDRTFIQGDSGGKVNILGCDRLGHGEKNSLYEHVPTSEWLLGQSCLNLQIQKQREW